MVRAVERREQVENTGVGWGWGDLSGRWVKVRRSEAKDVRSRGCKGERLQVPGSSIQKNAIDRLQWVEMSVRGSD